MRKFNLIMAWIAYVAACFDLGCGIGSFIEGKAWFGVAYLAVGAVTACLCYLYREEYRRRA